MGRDRSKVRNLLVALGVAGVMTSACAADGTTPSTLIPDPAPITTSTEAAPTPTTTAPTPTTVAKPREPALPDVSMRPLATETLLAMLSDGGDVLTNEALAAATALDPTDEAEDHLRFGRIVGVVGTSWPTEPGAIVRIDLFADAAGASGFLADRVGDLAKDIEGATPTLAIEAFPVDTVGDEALGVVVTHSDAVETAVFFRMGRIVASTSLERPGDARVAAQYLAEDVAGSVVATLTRTRDTGMANAIPAYSFDTEHSVEIDGVPSIWRATGVVSGDDRRCEITLADRTRHDLRSVDGILWARAGDAVEYAPVGGPGVEERSHLALCPSWALDARATGLDAVVGPEPASYVLDGVRVLGHRGDASDLAAILDGDVAGVEVRVFNVWIAEDTDWVIDLDLVVSGPARSLEGLLIDPVAPDARVTVTVRHRVTDLGSAPAVIPPA